MKTTNGPSYFTDPDKLAEFVLERMGNTINLGMVLGMGKPNHIANALFKKAVENPDIRLQILTAISLEPPTWSTELERRFMKPLVERVWEGYVNLDYITALRKNRLPDNIQVSEFFYKAGAFLNSVHMQKNYISTNYTHASRDVNANGMNVAAQLLAEVESHHGAARLMEEGRREAAIGNRTGQAAADRIGCFGIGEELRLLR